MANGRNPGESFLCASKEEFLRKATEITLLSHFALWSEGMKKMKQKTRDDSFSPVPPLQMGEKGFIVVLAQTEVPRRETGHLTWWLGEQLAFLELSFSGGGRDQQRSTVSLETLFSTLLSDDLSSLPWGLGLSRGKPKRRKALAPMFLKPFLVSPLLLVSRQMVMEGSRAKDQGRLLVLPIVERKSFYSHYILFLWYIYLGKANAL